MTDQPASLTPAPAGYADGLLERTGAAVTNFDVRLPKPQFNLARESLKAPYRLDFLGQDLGIGLGDGFDCFLSSETNLASEE